MHEDMFSLDHPFDDEEATNSGVMELYLEIADDEIRTAIEALPPGKEQHDYAVTALKIGLLALGQMKNRMDVERMRDEGERVVEKVAHTLEKHAMAMNQRVGETLGKYLDPEGGQFSNRVRALVEDDGELEKVIARQVGSEDSELSRHLLGFFGPDSPLMKALDPASAEGILQEVRAITEKTMEEQQRAILNEFSMDNREGALPRFLDRLVEQHGEVGSALGEKLAAVTAEFSLDDEDSGLSRLVNRVERASGQISRELSLDYEDSSLARMQRKLQEALEEQRQTQDRGLTAILEKVTEQNARKLEAKLSTRHGHTFEEALLNQLEEMCEHTSDVATHLANTTGLIGRSKVGDIVIEIDHDSKASSAKIVVEAKEDASYTLKKALDEIDLARKNRGASIGIFVFSKSNVPDSIPPIKRYGKDWIVVWDAEDSGHDPYLCACLSAARALCVRESVIDSKASLDFLSIERAILAIEKQAEGLSEIRTSAETIERGSEKILNRVRIMKKELQSQTETLNGKVSEIKAFVGEDTAG